MADGNTRILNWIWGLVGSGIVAGTGYGLVRMNDSISKANDTGASLNTNVMVLTTQVAALKETIADKTKDTYSAAAADQLRSSLTNLITSNVQRIQKLEDTIDRLAERVQKLELDAAERKGRSEGPRAQADELTNHLKGV